MNLNDGLLGLHSNSNPSRVGWKDLEYVIEYQYNNQDKVQKRQGIISLLR